MLTIPLAAVPNQTVNVTLANQPCTINIYYNGYGTFCDLYVNDALIIGGVLCLNAVRIVRYAYLGFIGDLAFYDTQGESDPIYPGFGSTDAAQFPLFYIEAADLA